MNFNKRAFKQIGLEAALPAVAGIGWTFINLGWQIASWNIKDALNIFMFTFVGVAWVSGQVFRIIKQTRVDRNFEGIADVLTGGQTFPIVLPIFAGSDGGLTQFMVGLILRLDGQHSLYDLTVTVTNVEKMRDVHASGEPIFAQSYQNRFQLGTLGKAYEEHLMSIDPQPSASWSFFIVSFSRNGQYKQTLLLRRVDSNWTYALKILRDDKAIHEYISPKFPIEALNQLNPNSPLM